jgi:hypothetical protein
MDCCGIAVNNGGIASAQMGTAIATPNRTSEEERHSALERVWTSQRCRCQMSWRQKREECRKHYTIGISPQFINKVIVEFRAPGLGKLSEITCPSILVFDLVVTWKMHHSSSHSLSGKITPDRLLHANQKPLCPPSPAHRLLIIPKRVLRSVEVV